MATRFDHFEDEQSRYVALCLFAIEETPKFSKKLQLSYMNDHKAISCSNLEEVVSEVRMSKDYSDDEKNEIVLRLENIAGTRGWKHGFGIDYSR